MDTRQKPMVYETPTLLSELRRVSLEVSLEQLRGWRRAGLIERPTQVSKGRYGSEYWWTEEAFLRAMVIARALEGRSPSFDRAARALIGANLFPLDQVIKDLLLVDLEAARKPAEQAQLVELLLDGPLRLDPRLIKDVITRSSPGRVEQAVREARGAYWGVADTWNGIRLVLPQVGLPCLPPALLEPTEDAKPSDEQMATYLRIGTSCLLLGAVVLIRGSRPDEFVRGVDALFKNLKSALTAGVAQPAE